MNDLFRRGMALALPLMLVAGCSPAQRSIDPPLAHAQIGGPFTLTDQNGRRVSDHDLAGKFRLIYFGYTYCPDVCPVDVQNLAHGVKVLEKRDAALARQIVPIFITVDPARDTPAVLKQFVGAFHPRMLGLTGSPQEIAKVAKEFGIFYKAEPKDATGAYTVDHSRVAYLMGRDGRPLALVRHDGTPDQIADDLQQWAR
ncbi:MAG: SCO family protein [Sphingomonas sp.]